jgi:hypothetical protein
MSKPKSKCGHDLTKYNRSDGRCGRCHTLRNQKYRSTPKGRKMNLAREERRRNNPRRIYYRLKWLLNASINAKRQRIAELERTLQ